MRASSIVLLSTVLMAACGNGVPEPTDPGPRPVRLAEVRQGPAAPPVIATGSLSLRDEARLSFKTGGVVRRIEVREGQRVSAGQMLATLDTAEVDAGVSQARAAHEKALRDLERGRRLAADNVLTQQQLDDLGTAEEVARAQLRAAEFNRRYAVIEAPADGTVLRRLAEPNELVSGGQPVLLLGADESGFVLRLGIPDHEVLRLREGDRVAIDIDAYPDAEFDGEVIEIGSGADPRTGTFRVEVAVEPGERRLVSGMIARAVINGSGQGDAQRDYVPLDALVEGDARSTLIFVYDADSGQAREVRRPVLFLSNGMAALGEPLPANMQVVTDGASFLRDGETVRVVD
jgi:RND family efflux transporter MFP subunit